MAAIGMPPHILALFAARKPLDPFPAFKSKHPRRYIGLSDYVKKFELTPPPAPIPFESPRQRKQRIKRTKLLQHLQQQQQLVELYKPLQDKNIQGDPFCTLFIGKLSYDTTEKKLKREFEVYGQIKRIKIITNKEGKSRGYAFIEYFNDKDMKEAYKKGDGTKIDNKRILVDVERARTVPGWLPRRLGGGRGPPRGAGKNQPDLSTLVAQINNPNNNNNNNNNNINKDKERDKEKDREREKERDRDRDRDRERERERDRDRDRDRHRDRDRGGDRGDRRRRSRSRSREKRRDDRDRDRRR